MLWFFHWVGGGYNSVLADTREEALEAAKLLGSPTARFNGLVPDESTLVEDPDGKRTEAENAKYAGMFD